MRKKFRKAVGIVESFFFGLSAKNVGVYSSSAAFYIFLSLVPCIMLVCSFLPASKVDSAELSQMVQLIMPETVSSFMEEIIREVYASSLTVKSISAITTLWSASKSMASIMRGIEHVSDDYNREKYIKLRLKAMLYSVVLILIIYVLMLSTVVLNFLVSQDIIVLRFNKILAPVIFALVLTLAYRFIPDKKTPIRYLLPGACAASFAWTLFTFAYSSWLNMSNSFGVYGSLGSVIVTLMWIFFSLYILLSGAYFNRFLMRFRNPEKIQARANKKH